MAKFKVKIHISACNELRNSEEVQQYILERAERIKAKADSIGSGKYIADVQPGRTRAHGMVKTTDAKSMASNAKHNTLLKSIDAGRG